MIPRSKSLARTGGHSMRAVLAAMQYRCHELAGGNTAHLIGNYKSLESDFQNAIAMIDRQENPANDDDRALAKKTSTELCGLMDKARGGDETSRTELCRLRATQIDLYVRATSNFLPFFETVTLEEDEQAVFEHSYRNEMRCRYIGQDGGIKSTAAVKAQKQTFIDLRQLVSDAVGYQIRDINLGRQVADIAQKTVDIGFDLANKVDYDAYTLYLSLLGNFNTTGPKLNRTWIPNSRIQTGSLPTTNVWDLNVMRQFETPGSTPGAQNNFRLAVIRAIMNYCASWGNIFGAPMQPTGKILVPAVESTELSLEITPVGNTNNAVANALMGTFNSFEYLGVKWTLIPDVTLPVGSCFPILNRPVGHYYTKPSMDEEYVETDKLKNWETRAEGKVLNFGCPEAWRPFALQIIYGNG